jgi:hypothetical protein
VKPHGHAGGKHPDELSDPLHGAKDEEAAAAAVAPAAAEATTGSSRDRVMVYLFEMGCIFHRCVVERR